MAGMALVSTGCAEKKAAHDVRCQKLGWTQYYRGDMSEFLDEDACATYAARERLVPAKAYLLCASYGGTFWNGPDHNRSNPQPVIWVCNSWPRDYEREQEQEAALEKICYANGGVATYGFGTENDLTCYADVQA